MQGEQNCPPGRAELMSPVDERNFTNVGEIRFILEACGLGAAPPVKQLCFWSGTAPRCPGDTASGEEFVCLGSWKTQFGVVVDTQKNVLPY